ncbi:MAG: hypothetical protein RLZ10_52, partial [Bacteroidota bacterium]
MKENCKVLLICVSTFNYEKAIKEELESRGYDVDLYDEKPSNNTLAKGIIRLKKSLYGYYLNRYYRRIESTIYKKSYDFLFVVKGESIPLFFIESFKKRFPKALLLYYTWDSFKNNSNPLKYIHLFDRRFTFDPVDAKKYNLLFRPLFYLNEYSKIINKSNNQYKYDLLFLGTAHTDRYTISNKIFEICKSYNLSYFQYYFIQGKLVFLYKRFFDKTFHYFNKDKVSFKALTKNEILMLFDKSRVILDIHHNGQYGLTMRTFESLGSQKKLITTNQDIKNYK